MRRRRNRRFGRRVDIIDRDKRTMAYDPIGRVIASTRTLDGVAWIERQSWDAVGRPDTHHDASTDAGSTAGTKTDYSSDGYPVRVREAANNTLYQEVLTLTARGQVRQERYNDQARLTTALSRLVWLIFPKSLSKGCSDQPDADGMMSERFSGWCARRRAGWPPGQAARADRRAFGTSPFNKIYRLGRTACAQLRVATAQQTASLLSPPRLDLRAGDALTSVPG